MGGPDVFKDAGSIVGEFQNLLPELPFFLAMNEISLRNQPHLDTYQLLELLAPIDIKIGVDGSNEDVSVGAKTLAPHNEAHVLKQVKEFQAQQMRFQQ